MAVFLTIKARRYRFFDFWRVRAHILETQFFGPILLGQGVQVDNGWNEVLYQDYLKPRLHITYWDALGRRLRRNYCWIFTIQLVSYIGKLTIHPQPIASLDELLARATIGPVPGQLVLLAGLVFHELDRNRLRHVARASRTGPGQELAKRRPCAGSGTARRLKQNLDARSNNRCHGCV